MLLMNNAEAMHRDCSGGLALDTPLQRFDRAVSASRISSILTEAAKCQP